MTSTAPLWRPSNERIQASAIHRYMEWLRSSRGLEFPDYEVLYRWSIGNLTDFWSSIWDYFRVIGHHPYSEVLSSHRMPGAHWFSGATLNYAEPDPACPVCVARESGPVNRPWVLKVSCTERGQCAAAVIRKWH